MKGIKGAIAGTIAVTALVLGLTGCGVSSSAADKSQKASNRLQSQVYQSKNNIEFRNYNLRQKVADNPATILWCTFFPPGVQGVGNGSTGGQAFTVPIAGKLTSSAKRPYDELGWSGDTYGVNRPGPDHMYGSSAEYRYGFDPTLSIYYDFTSLPSFCTTEPTIWQAQATRIVVQTSAVLSNLTSAAEAAIRAGNPQKALADLKKAEATQR